MHLGESVRPCQLRNRPAQLKNPVISPRRQLQLPHGRFHQSLAGIIQYVISTPAPVACPRCWRCRFLQNADAVAPERLPPWYVLLLRISRVACRVISGDPPLALVCGCQSDPSAKYETNKVYIKSSFGRYCSASAKCTWVIDSDPAKSAIVLDKFSTY